MSQIDTAELLYTVLTSDSALTALLTDGLGVHIYGPPGLPPDFSLRKALMFLGDGEDTNPYTPIGQADYAIYCYGQESWEAAKVYTALRGALNRKKHTRYTLSGGQAIFQYALMQVGRQDRTDPAEGWPFVYCSFVMHFIEVYV